jgi:hypothetical protein
VRSGAARILTTARLSVAEQTFSVESCDHDFMEGSDRGMTVDEGAGPISSSFMISPALHLRRWSQRR